MQVEVVVSMTRRTYRFVDRIGVVQSLVPCVGGGGPIHGVTGDGGVCYVQLGGMLGEDGSTIAGDVRGAPALRAAVLHIGDVAIADRTWNGYSTNQSMTRRLKSQRCSFEGMVQQRKRCHVMVPKWMRMQKDMFQWQMFFTSSKISFFCSDRYSGLLMDSASKMGSDKTLRHSKTTSLSLVTN